MNSPLSLVSRYKTVQVTTSSPVGLVVMLYDGIFRFCEEARTAMKNSDRALAGTKISRAHAIIEELTASLRRSESPVLCEQLDGLYTFCADRLVQASIEQSEEKLADVERVLSPLREAWREVAKQSTKAA